MGTSTLSDMDAKIAALEAKLGGGGGSSDEDEEAAAADDDDDDDDSSSSSSEHDDDVNGGGGGGGGKADSTTSPWDLIGSRASANKDKAKRDKAGGLLRTPHSTDVESPPLPPRRVCMSTGISP